MNKRQKMGKIMKQIYALLISSLFFSSAFASDLAGKWKTVDDKTGFSRADVMITKNADGTYNGKIITIRPLPDKPLEPRCVNCKGSLKNVPLVGLQILTGFKANPKTPNEFTNGTVLDPLSGNVYNGKAKITPRGNRLTMRGYIGVSLLGRSATWIRID